MYLVLDSVEIKDRRIKIFLLEVSKIDKVELLFEASGC